MRKLRLLVIAAAIIGAAVFVHRNYEFEGFQNFSLKPRGAEPTQQVGVEPPGREAQDTIRIASFNIQVFGTSKANKPEVMRILADVIRSFDVVAIQEVRSKDDTLLPRFVELINSTGVQYDYVIGPRLGRSNSKEQYAFIFNTATIEVDRSPSATYTIPDPEDLLHREPLVGMFRCRGPAPDRAFTFRLVNIHTDPDEVKQEVNVLDNVIRNVLADTRHEDDVILLGDLNASEHELGELGQMSGITWAISDTPTNTKGTKSYDNILFIARETNEYTGRSGVVDMVRRFNSNTEWIYDNVSDHLPIWAEFSIYEGGNRGRVAAKPTAATKQ